MITHKRLLEVLDYDAASGVFIRKISTSSRAQAGDVAGWLKKQPGYPDRLVITVEKHKIHAGVLAWFYMYGVWPKNCIDHINHNPLDNRCSNLREATLGENQWNRVMRKPNSSGFKGVKKHRNRWVAQVWKGDTRVYSKSFATIQEAVEAREVAVRQLHGVFGCA